MQTLDLLIQLPNPQGAILDYRNLHNGRDVWAQWLFSGLWITESDLKGVRGKIHVAHQYQHQSMFKWAKAAEQLVPPKVVTTSHQQPSRSKEDVGTNLSELDVLPETKLAPSKYLMPSTPSDCPRPGIGLTQSESSTCISGANSLS